MGNGKKVEGGVFLTEVLYNLDTMTPIYFVKPKDENRVEKAANSPKNNWQKLRSFVRTIKKSHATETTFV